MKKHLQHLEVAIGLRDEVVDRQKVEPLTASCVRKTWFIPPPDREKGVAITPHPLGEVYGVARIASTR